MTRSYREAKEIFQAGVGAVDPRKMVRDSLDISGTVLTADGVRYDLSSFPRIHLLGAGKACDQMANGVEELLGDRISGGVIITPDGTEILTPRVPRRVGAHPIPDEEGVRAAEELVSIAAAAGADDLVVVLLSGGGSALLTAPAAGILLEDIRVLTAKLLKRGASIDELNTIRKHLSRTKGGGLARLIYPARVMTLILSDVVGDDPAVIASGPTAPDPTTFRDCLEIMDRYQLREWAPSRIRERLERGRGGVISETPVAADPIFQKVQNIVIGNNRIALLGAAEKGRELGYKTVILSDRVAGDTRRSAKLHCALAVAVSTRRQPGDTPVCLLSGGETTVVVKGTGLGGRNSEFVLASALDIAGKEGITILSGGTDGIDAETPSAGAICDGTTLERGDELRLSADNLLERNDSYTYFRTLGDELITGPTGTNVMDLRVMLLN